MNKNTENIFILTLILILLLLFINLKKKQTKFNNKYNLLNNTDNILNDTDNLYNNIKISNNIKKLNLEKIKNTKKQFLWLYITNPINSRDWINFYSRTRIDNIPEYIKLSINTIYNNCEKDFNIIILNDDNINNFLPDLNININKFSNIDYEKKLFYISLNILYNFGGVWITPSLVMKNLKLLVDKLNNYDFIGFSCHHDIYRCINIPNSPNIHIYASKPNTKFILDCINYMKLNIINSYNVPSYNFEHLSRKILKTFLIKNIENNNMKYFQFGPEYIGTRDYDNKVITVNNFLSNNNTLLWKPEKVLLIIIDTKGIDNISKFKWFEKMSKKQILESNLWFSKLIRLSINFNRNKYFYTSSINNNRLLEKNIDIHPTNINDFKKLLLNSNKYFNNPWDIVYNSSTRNS